MSDRPLQVGDRYLVRHNSAQTKAIVKEILYRVDVHSFEQQPIHALNLNDIARIKLRTARPLVFDAYRQNRASGGLILVNEGTFDTVAAGMLRDLPRGESTSSEFDI
jgi:sulfate adenylyltransferase subunit 1